MKTAALSEVKDDLSRFLRIAEHERVLITVMASLPGYSSGPDRAEEPARRVGRGPGRRRRISARYALSPTGRTTYAAAVPPSL